MKAFGWLMARAGLVLAAELLGLVLFLGLNGQLSGRTLSDTLVYASFSSMALGTLVGMFNLGYKRRPLLPGEPPEGPFEHALKELLKAETLGWTIVLAGVLCFGASIAADLLL